MSTTTKGEVGITVHFLGALTLHESKTLGSTARNVSYGSEAILTADIIDANRDRYGQWPLLGLLDDEPGQIKAWGKVKVRRGPWPADLPRIEPGSPEHDDARAAALQAAKLLPTEQEQRAAVASVRRAYGAASESKSRTLMEYSR